MNQGKREIVLRTSVIMNVLLALIVIALVLNKMGILTRTVVSEYSYLSNPQYEAYETMFELNDSQTDVIFVGDSITARGSFDEFFPGTRVLNRGIGSDITEGVFNRMEEVMSHNPQKIFIMVGINDIGKEIPLETSMDYYKQIILMIKNQNNDCEIYAESVLPASTIDLGKIEQFNNALKVLCDEESVNYVDLYNLFLFDGKPDMNLISDDGVHLNGYGYSTWISAIKDFVNP